MTNNFWLYFLLSSVLVGAIILSIPYYYYSSINPPLFEDAVSTCKDISNQDIYATQYGTLQDKCIANFMSTPRNWEYTFNVFLISILILFNLFIISRLIFK